MTTQGSALNVDDGLLKDLALVVSTISVAAQSPISVNGQGLRCTIHPTRAKNAVAVLERVSTYLAALPKGGGLEQALDDIDALLRLVEADTGANEPAMADEFDIEAVGTGQHESGETYPLPMTFGHVRRARKAVDALRALPASVSTVEGRAFADGCLSQFHLDNWTDDDFRAHIPAVRKSLSVMLGALSPAIADRPTMAELDAKLSREDAVAWTILTSLHENIPEEDRPQSWSDMDEKQEARIRSAARAVLAIADRPVSTGGDGKCGECGHDAPERYRVFGRCHICAANQSVRKRDDKIKRLREELDAALSKTASEGVEPGELRLAKMQANAAGSLLLDVQQDCIKAVTALRQIAELRYAEDANEPFDEALDIADAALAAQGTSPSPNPATGTEAVATAWIEPRALRALENELLANALVYNRCDSKGEWIPLYLATPLKSEKPGVGEDGWFRIDDPENPPPKDATAIAFIVATEKNKTFFGKPLGSCVFPVYFDDQGHLCEAGTWKPDVGIISGNFVATHWRPLPAAPLAGEDAK